MDHFGPYELTKKCKRWGLIFICLTTRAIHLEDVSGPGSEPFLKALARFTSRRGIPKVLRSDRGTSFVVLAKQQEATLDAYAKELEGAALDRFRIDLKFNPAGAPHWGGSWERMIKEVKKIIVGISQGFGRWTVEDFQTFLVRAEGILNRRPLAFGDDGQVLTPMHIISPFATQPVGPPFGAVTFQSIKQLKLAEQCFWDKWQKFYLPSISAARQIGDAKVTDFKPGDKVLLREGSNPLVDTWTVATLVEVYPTAADGVVRSALFDVEGAKVVRDMSRVSLLEGPVLRRRAALPAPSGGECRPGSSDSGYASNSFNSPLARGDPPGAGAAAR
jgi:hypothetical protein